MAAISTIIIHYSAQKRVIIFLFSGFMLLAGLGILANPFREKLFANPIVIILGVIFFIGSFAIIIFARKLFIYTTALLIDDDGVTDNSGNGFVGFIPWQDVMEIKKRKMDGERFICVFVKNPEEYVNKGKSLIQRKRMDFNNTYFETPIAISSRGLDMDFYSLLEMFQRKYNLYIATEDSLNRENSSVDL